MIYYAREIKKIQQRWKIFIWIWLFNYFDLYNALDQRQENICIYVNTDQ